VIDQAVGPPGQLRIHSIDRWSLAADGKTLLLTSHLNAKLSFVYDKQ
jgi:hypothetical protein